MTLTNTKPELRASLKKQRADIPNKRKAEASSQCVRFFKRHLSSFQKVLSFAPMTEEIDLWPLNQELAKQGKLLLPRVVDNELWIFPVNDLEKDLQRSSYGILEPEQNEMKRIDLSIIDCIIVPGLGFTGDNHRIGYGKGYYDRILAKCDHAQKIGAGFFEQKVDDCMQEPHDISLDQVFLF